MRVLRWPAPPQRRDRVLVCLHGAGLTANTWRGFAAAIAGQAGVVAPDLRGHGASSWDPDGDYRLTSYAEDVAAVIANTNVRRPVMVGMSLGAMVALVVAASSRTAIRALVLIDAGPDGSDQTARDRRGELMRATFASLDEAVQAVHAQEPGQDPSILRDRLARALRLRADGRYGWSWDPRIRWRDHPDPHVVRKHAAERRRAIDAAVSRISVPVLVVRGARSDMFSAEAAERTVARFSAARSVVIPDAGHAVQRDQPATLAKEIEIFLEDVE